MNARFVFILLSPAFIAWLAIRVAASAPFAARLADRPNERSLHATPRPRVGGIGVMLGALPLAAWTGDETLRIVIACAAVLFVVSLADDVRSLPALPRLAAHLVAALAAAWATSASLQWPAVAWIAAVFAIVWMTNLFNFMDGSDGLAGGMAVIGFGAYAVAARDASPPLALCSAAVASASAGFLLWNFPPARVFLGDAGSIPLGFLAGALGLVGVGVGAWPPWFPVMVFAPFVVDASATIARRVVRGERFWRAHRSHYYQRLILAGWSHRRLALLVYATAAGGAVLAGLALESGPLLQCGIIVVWAAAWLLLLLIIERHLRRATPATGLRGSSNR